MEKIILGLLGSVIVLSGCRPQFQTQDLSSLGAGVSDSLTCPAARSQIFDAYYEAYQKDPKLATNQEEQEQIKTLASRIPVFRKASKSIQSDFSRSVFEIHRILTADLASMGLKAVAQAQKLSNETPVESESDPLLHLARLEMRSEIDASYIELNQKLDAALSKSAALAVSAGLTCGHPDDPESSAPVDGANPPANPDRPSEKFNHPLYGARYTMATAYQACRVLDLPSITDAVENAEGVVKGSKIDEGYGREYTDVDQLVRTHYYHRGQSYGPGCADQRARPLVYDYGGKPSVQSQSLNLFVNSGGGSALGIDCSAFVSTAAAVAGNRYNPSTASKPVYTRFVSRDFIDPIKSKWSCYDSVEVTRGQTIEPGDIGAVEGHVVMIDEVGADPFGISRMKSSSECSSLTIENFDFTVIQSSPEKGSLGINRFAAKDYLKGSGKMVNLFLGYAKQACLSQIDGKVRKPQTAVYGMIRHKQTASCLAPRISLVNEACIQSCSSLK